MVLSLTSPSSGSDRSRQEMTESILKLALEIIYILTGEDYVVRKKVGGQCMIPSSCHYVSGRWSRTHSPIMEPPPHSLIPEKFNNQNILDLANKIIELLTGEVPIRCQDVTVHFSMVEWEYIDGHKDLYKDVMMEKPITFVDGSTDRNIVKRCPSHLYSQHCLEDDSQVHQVPGAGRDARTQQANAASQTCLAALEPGDAVSVTRDAHQSAVLHGASQGEDLLDIKVEVMEGEEMYEMTDHWCKEEEAIPVDINTADGHIKDLKKNVSTFPNRQVKDVTQDSPRENSSTQMFCSGHNSRDLLSHHVNQEESFSHRSVIITEPGELELIAKSQLEKSLCGFSHQRTLAADKEPQFYESRKCLINEVNCNHLKNENSLKKFSCALCGNSFTRKSNLFHHQRSHKGERPFSCQECGKCLANKSNLVKHQKIHTGDKPYSCSECGKSFSKKSDVVKHYRLHTGDKPFSCLECGKHFANKTNLMEHQRIHTGEKPFSCSECGKCFSQKSGLAQHQIIHTGEKPFSCSECGKCFNKKSRLVHHQKIHTGEKPFSCSECGNCYTQKSFLVRHQRIHTGDKLFSCSECEKCFTQKSDLVDHQRIHTGERPFLCRECGKCFTQKSGLVQHQKIHNEDKPFPCSECGNSFAQKSYLVRHQRIHKLEKPYSCSECGKGFTQKAGLIGHLKIHTGEKLFS